MRDPILIWGAGARGLLLSAALNEAGMPSVLVDSRADRLGLLASDGLTVEDAMGRRVLYLDVVKPERLGEYSWRRIVYCGEADGIEQALRLVVPTMPSDGYFVTAAEGLTEQVASRIVGGQRVLGCLMLVGASCPQPGFVHDSGYRRVVLGELDGRFSERAEEVYDFLKLLAPQALISNNLWGFRWTRLLYFSLHLAAAALGKSLTACLDEPRALPMLVETARLVARVAALSNIDLEPIDGFDPAGFDPRASESLSLDTLLALDRQRLGTWPGPSRTSQFEALVSPVIEAGRLARIDVSPLAKMIDRLRGAQTVG